MGDYVRVSQFAMLVAGSPGSTARVSQVAAEVLCDQPSGRAARVSQVAVEVLCSTPVFTYSVTATTAFAVKGAAAASASVLRYVSASTSMSLSSSTRGYVPGPKYVLAVTGLGVAGSGGGVGRSPGNVNASGGHSVSLAGSASVKVARSIRASATTSLFIRSTAYTPSERLVSATTTILLSGSPVGRSSSIYVSAMSGIKLTGKGSRSAILGLNVSATTSFLLSDSVSKIVRGYRFASASTRMGLSSTAAATKSIVARVSGITSVSISSSSSETADVGVSASVALAMLANGKQSRDIYASAALYLGVRAATRTTNLKTVNAESTFAFTVSASVELTGTEAQSDLILNDLAQAVVWIPWRRSGLSLNPGGNLPHS